MDLTKLEVTPNAKFNDIDYPPMEIYDELVKEGVNCSECTEQLSDGDIRSHRIAGIVSPKDMLCISCWHDIATETEIY